MFLKRFDDDYRVSFPNVAIHYSNQELDQCHKTERARMRLLSFRSVIWKRPFEREVIK
jgi:hypothetical protein